jgi:vancomycin resistance protein YoaR
MQNSRAVDPPPVRVAQAYDSETTVQKISTEAGKRAFRPALFVLAACLVVPALVLLAFAISYNGRVYPGVKVLGTNLGGKNSTEAIAAIREAAAGYPSGDVQVSGEGHVWTLAASDLGVGIDAETTANTALGIGRDGDLRDNLGTIIGSLTGGRQIAPVLKTDGGAVDKAVAQIASSVDRSAVDSRLEQAADGGVNITASSAGRLLDRDALRASLVAATGAVPFAPVTAAMRDVAPKVTEGMLKGAASQVEQLTGQAVTLKLGKGIWTLSPADLRAMLDLAAPANGGSEWGVTLNDGKLTARLQPVAEDVKVESVDAAVVIGKGKVTLQEDKAGRELDVPAAVGAIKAAFKATEPEARNVQLPVKVVPANAHTADVQAIYDKANGLITQGIRLHFRDDGYILRNSSVTGFLSVEKKQGGPGLDLAIDKDVLSNRISGVAYNINRNPADARFRMVNGAPARVADARDGYKVNVDKSLGTTLAAIASYTGGERLQVELSVDVTEPTLKDADLASISTPDLLGTGQTSYAGSSAERAWNVGLGTRRVDGALIPPGGVFSTVDAIGDLTLDAGFKMGYAIVHTERGLTTVPAEAGGICQVATTLFHSVFWAGLPVVERNWHSYWIGTYGRKPTGMQGLDATIAPPEKDFRFKNTTGHWILIKATADGQTVNFQLYGVNPGWKVNVSGPVITSIVKTTSEPITEYSSQLPAGKKVLVEHAQDGFRASITRTVTDAGGNVLDAWTAKSIYAPAHNRYLIGTGN